jgi:hypothetical protein
MNALECTVRRTSEVRWRRARPCEKCPGATSCTVMPGSVVWLKTSSHSSCSCTGHDSSGGVMWYQDGPSCSPGAAHDIMAIAHRRDSGAGPTRHSPSWYGTRSCSRVKVIARSVQCRADSITPAPSG